MVIDDKCLLLSEYFTWWFYGVINIFIMIFCCGLAGGNRTHISRLGGIRSIH